MNVGDLVSKVGSDYRMDATVVAVFKKLSGATRIVVEDDRGTLFIGNEQGWGPRLVKYRCPDCNSERADWHSINCSAWKRYRDAANG